jgi:hypothetical protein
MILLNRQLEKRLKIKLFQLRRHTPRCYLFSSKYVLTLFIILMAYFIIMDIKLFISVKHRGPLVKNANTSNHEKSPLTVFSPLPVKKIMIAEVTHFIRSPLAELVEHSLSFSEIFPFISANLISSTHCFLSVVSIRFLISDSLFWRQVGVCIFQFRNFLDSFDGVIYRAHAKRSSYKSHYGSWGYYVDAVSDVFGGACVIIAVGIYLLKHRPLNKQMTRCFRLPDDFDDAINLISTSSTACQQHQQQIDEKLGVNGSKISLNDDYYTSDKVKEGHLASKVAIITSVIMLGIRLGLSVRFFLKIG